MPKIIKIYSCKNCPHYSDHDDEIIERWYKHWCIKQDAEIPLFAAEIPDWCPLSTDKRKTESEIRKELASMEHDYKNKKLEYLPHGKALAAAMIMILKWVLNEEDEE